MFEIIDNYTIQKRKIKKITKYSKHLNGYIGGVCVNMW